MPLCWESPHLTMVIWSFPEQNSVALYLGRKKSLALFTIYSSFTTRNYYKHVIGNSVHLRVKISREWEPSVPKRFSILLVFVQKLNFGKIAEIYKRMHTFIIRSFITYDFISSFCILCTFSYLATKWILHLVLRSKIQFFFLLLSFYLYLFYK